MWGILIPLLAGIAVGYFMTGKQDKSRMFKIGLLWALLIALVLNVIGFFVDMNPATGSDGFSFWGFVVSVVISLVIFLVGVWLGDMIEGRRHKRALPPGRARL